MTLNYQTIAFVMDIPTKQAKEMLSQIMNKDKLTAKDQIIHHELVGKFGTIRSVDSRYDGQDKFMFYLQQRKESFRKYLNESQLIKKKRFTGKYEIFYNLLTQEQIDFCHSVLEQTHKFLYGNKQK